MGAIIAYTVCKPWAEKLEGYSAKNVQTNQLIVEGALLIKANTNPRLIADQLSSRLAPKANRKWLPIMRQHQVVELKRPPPNKRSDLKSNRDVQNFD